MGQGKATPTPATYECGACGQHHVMPVPAIPPGWQVADAATIHCADCATDGPSQLGAPPAGLPQGWERVFANRPDGPGLMSVDFCRGCIGEGRANIFCALADLDLLLADFASIPSDQTIGAQHHVE